MPPPPLSIHSEVHAPPEQPNPPRAQPDPVVNWLHQNPVEPNPQQAQQLYEPYRDPYYEPIKRTFSVQGEGFPSNEIPREDKALSELKEQIRLLTQKVTEGSDDLT